MPEVVARLSRPQARSEFGFDEQGRGVGSVLTRHVGTRAVIEAHLGFRSDNQRHVKTALPQHAGQRLARLRGLVQDAAKAFRGGVFVGFRKTAAPPTLQKLHNVPRKP